MRKISETQFKMAQERDILREIAEQREKSTPDYVPPDWLAAFRNRVLA